MGLMKKARDYWSKVVPSQTELTGCNMAEQAFIESQLGIIYHRIITATINEVATKERLEKKNILRTFADDRTVLHDHGLSHWIVRAMLQTNHIVLDKRLVEYIDGLSYWRFERAKGANPRQPQPDQLVLDFTKYYLTDILRLYFALLYKVMDGASNGITVSSAILVKIADLNKLASEDRNVETLKAQLTDLDAALRKGNLGYIDGDSSVEYPTYDTQPTEKAINMLWTSISNVLGLPLSWVLGETGNGTLSDTGESERKALRRGIERYYTEIIQPILENVYHHTFDLVIEIENVSEFGEMLANMGTDTMLTHSAKVEILCNTFGLRQDMFNDEQASEEKERARLDELTSRIPLTE